MAGKQTHQQPQCVIVLSTITVPLDETLRTLMRHHEICPINQLAPQPSDASDCPLSERAGSPPSFFPSSLWPCKEQLEQAQKHEWSDGISRPDRGRMAKDPALLVQGSAVHTWPPTTSRRLDVFLNPVVSQCHLSLWGSWARTRRQATGTAVNWGLSTAKCPQGQDSSPNSSFG